MSVSLEDSDIKMSEASPERAKLKSPANMNEDPTPRKSDVVNISQSSGDEGATDNRRVSN